MNKIHRFRSSWFGVSLVLLGACMATPEDIQSEEANEAMLGEDSALDQAELGEASQAVVATANIPISCAWSTDHVKSGPSGAIVTTVCKESGSLRATKQQGYGSAASLCTISPVFGYTYDGSCKTPTIMKIIPLPNYCPVPTDGCSTSTDGKLELHASWLSPEVPYFNRLFQRVCDAHDTCYGTFGKSKLTCDDQFRADMRHECDDEFDAEWYEPSYPVEQLARRHCKDAADVYFSVVSSDAVSGESYANAQAATLACQSK